MFYHSVVQEDFLEVWQWYWNSIIIFCTLKFTTIIKSHDHFDHYSFPASYLHLYLPCMLTVNVSTNTSFCIMKKVKIPSESKFFVSEPGTSNKSDHWQTLLPSEKTIQWEVRLVRSAKSLILASYLKESYVPAPDFVLIWNKGTRLYMWFPDFLITLEPFFKWSLMRSSNHWNNEGARACILSRFSRVRLCDPMECSPPGSSVHGILQAWILPTQGSSPHLLYCRQILYRWATREAQWRSYLFVTE